MEELKPCPFCGTDELELKRNGDYDGYITHPFSPQCPMSSRQVPVSGWGMRIDYMGNEE